jgi:hypothetical protein
VKNETARTECKERKEKSWKQREKEKKAAQISKSVLNSKPVLPTTAKSDEEKGSNQSSAIINLSCPARPQDADAVAAINEQSCSCKTEKEEIERGCELKKRKKE